MIKKIKYTDIVDLSCVKCEVCDVFKQETMFVPIKRKTPPFWFDICVDCLKDILENKNVKN